ncbi:hypothetical protein GQ53DRAFT_883648 [Thozetella sp. PMI_491]|nr:hypothetical protein GQ53DRAFT_883648 [Thozetella sp. PMI_491]
MPALPSTCLSVEEHGRRVTNATVHYNACLRDTDRRRFFEKLPPEAQQRILRQKDNVDQLRHRLETSQQGYTAAAHLRGFKLALAQWRTAANRPPKAYSNSPLSDSTRYSPHTLRSSLETDVEQDIKAPVVYLKNSLPFDAPQLPNKFPHQKVPLGDLLSDDEAKNPLMQPCEAGVVRYFHLPANNMAWVEEVIARYYHERRPDADDFLTKHKTQRARTKTEMLLRPEYWQGQQNFDETSEVHARHMRPICDTISINSVAAEPIPKNLVLFMPYLHWETDRGRVLSARAVKEVSKQQTSSISEVVDQAQHQLASAHGPSGNRPPQHTSQGEPGYGGVMSKKKALGQLLWSAAALLEAMEFHVEEQLMAKYLHAPAPLHPRRTLDQSYYGALRNTGTRDRDQVVYRGTTPEPHDCAGTDTCLQCKEDVRKVSRIVMVDQLWLWILDENTVITSFPRRWGKNKPDPSAIHKSLRVRLKSLRQGEISTAYDLALIIVDECSRVFFDRTKTNDRPPNLVDLFADAIRTVTYKQTAAFDQFLIYTYLASREYKRDRNADASTQNTLLNINPEGNLLKEAKDIMDEIHIMTRVKEQQLAVMESLVKHIRRAMAPRIRSRRATLTRPEASWDLALSSVMDGTPYESGTNPGVDAQRLKEEEVREQAKWTLGKADQLLEDIRERITELQTLLQNALYTSAALKDLLTLKQQQAGVIEAREAVKQAALTLKQGQSIMLFTVVTIIFLPLSFFATLFGMNSVELNDGHYTLTEEFVYMFPISAGIILISFFLAFSRSAFTNSFVRLLGSAASFIYNTTTTWFLVKTGFYMAGRELAVQANRLHDREVKITGAMKAEVMRSKSNLEKMQAASAMRELVFSRSNTAFGLRDDAGGVSGRATPFSPYSPRNIPSPGPGTPFARQGPTTSSYGKGLGISVSEYDVELGQRITNESKPGSSRPLVPRHY